MEVQRKLDDARVHLAELQEGFAEYLKRLRSYRSGKAGAYEVLSYERYVDYLHMALERQRQVVEGLEAQLEERRRALQEAVRRRQVLESLRERQEESYRKYKNKVFQNFLDEVGARNKASREDICDI